jgi:4-phytase/acid phosphatase
MSVAQANQEKIPYTEVLLLMKQLSWAFCAKEAKCFFAALNLEMRHYTSAAASWTYSTLLAHGTTAKSIYCGSLYGMRTFLIATFLLAATFVPAQTQTLKNQSRDELRFTLVLSRHGIRPPFIAASALNLRSSDPWPEWEVPLGYLTPHGALAIQHMGAYMRLDLSNKGLLSAVGCPNNSEVYFYANTHERNIMSARNTLAGLAPSCDPLPVNTIVPAPGVEDPIFSAPQNIFPEPSVEAKAADRQAALGNDLTAFYSLVGNPELNEFAHILAPDPIHPAAKPILDDRRPLAAASSLVEDLLLEYTDDKPMSEVGWGRVDESTLRRLIPLHTKGFALPQRTPLTSRTEGSNLVAHILDTLEQAAQRSQTQNATSVRGAFGPVGARLVYINGHDDNLCNIGGLLNLHWNVDGIDDDTPPDSQIVFELWQNAKSKQYTIHLFYRAQTLDQLRSGQALTLANPPAEVDLTPPGCLAGQSCPFAAFDHAAHALLDPAYIKADLLPTEIAPSIP